jgi:hypothetical protein
VEDDELETVQVVYQALITLAIAVRRVQKGERSDMQAGNSEP